MTTVLAIDPGTTHSGWCIFDGSEVLLCGIDENGLLRDLIFGRDFSEEYEIMAFEMIQSMGMAVGQSTFETVFWSGRFVEAFDDDASIIRVTRRDEKIHLCGNMRAKDANIRQALIDKLGPVGTKKNPGPLFGVKSHIWSALAVAVTALETKL